MTIHNSDLKNQEYTSFDAFTYYVCTIMYIYIYDLYMYFVSYIYIYIYTLYFYVPKPFKKHRHFGFSPHSSDISISQSRFVLDPKAGVRIAARRIETWCKGERRETWYSWAPSTRIFLGGTGIHRECSARPQLFFSDSWPQIPRSESPEFLLKVGDSLILPCSNWKSE